MNTPHSPKQARVNYSDDASASARRQLWADVEERLQRLAVDLNTTPRKLRFAGAVLLLHNHGRGEGLPTGKRPRPPTTDGSR